MYDIFDICTPNKIMMRKHFIKFLLFLIPISIYSQDDKQLQLLIAGEVSEYFSEDAMPGVSVKLLLGSSYANNTVTDAKGKYELALDFEKEYTVLYEKAGFVPKKIIVSTKGVPPNERNKIASISK